MAIIASGVALASPVILPALLRIPLKVCEWRHRVWIWLRYGQTMTTDHNAVRLVAEIGAKQFLPGVQYVEALGRVVLIGREIAETHRQLRHLSDRPGQLWNTALDRYPISEKRRCSPSWTDAVIEPSTRFSIVETLQSIKRRLIGIPGQVLGLLYDLDQTANHLAALATSCGLGHDPTRLFSSIWVDAHEMQRAFNENGEAMIQEIESLGEYMDPYLAKMGASYNTEFLVSALKTCLAGSQFLQMADNLVVRTAWTVARDLTREGLALFTFTFFNWIPDILSPPEEIFNPPPDLPHRRQEDPETIKSRKCTPLPTDPAEIQKYFQNKLRQRT